MSIQVYRLFIRKWSGVLDKDVAELLFDVTEVPKRYGEEGYDCNYYFFRQRYYYLKWFDGIHYYYVRPTTNVPLFHPASTEAYRYMVETESRILNQKPKYNFRKYPSGVVVLVKK